MDLRFLCPDCKTMFSAPGIKQEYISPVYGPCAKIIASCPACGADSDEFRNPKPVKNKAANSSYPACGMGGCCCGGH